MRAMTFAPIAILGLLLTGCAAPLPSHTNSWLSYKYSFGCNGCADLTDEAEAFNYYCAIGVDPGACAGGQPPTLTFEDWKTANGFSAGGADVRATYGNLGDLRIGREMHCTQSGQNIACYVTNYGEPPFNGRTTSCAWAGCASGVDSTLEYDYPGLGNAITGAIHGTDAFATVAMVFTPSTGAPNNANNVTFYVFDANGLALSAALDGEGPKTVPRMCMACHGGAYDPSTHSVTGASFLPFDVFYFQYSKEAGYTLDDQQESFRELNALVKATNPKPAIKDLIDGLYPNGVGNPGSTAVDGHVPPGWSANPNLYTGVVRQYCRMCHIAQTVGFTTYQQFQSSASIIEDYVCNTRDMPNAQVPFASFWLKDKLALADLREFLTNEGVADLHGCK